MGSANDLSCPSCGAPVGIEEIVTPSGWRKLPPIKDMALLHFGDSHCQILGTYAPIADMKLARNEAVYFVHHTLLWKEPEVELSGLTIDSVGRQRRNGEISLLIASGPGRIAFSRDEPGELIAIPIDPGQVVDVRAGVFMVATRNVSHDWFIPQIWYSTSTISEGTELHFPLVYIDRFQAYNTPGLVLGHGLGNVYVRDLSAGETILIRPTSLVFNDPSVEMQLHIERPASNGRSFGRWQARYIWLRLTGPGRVAIQSVFDLTEDNGRILNGGSPSTEKNW